MLGFLILGDDDYPKSEISMGKERNRRLYYNGRTTTSKNLLC